MKFLRMLISPVLAAFVLLPAVVSMYAVPVHTHPNGQETEPEKRASFRYVCPMHDDVQSKKPGKCRKCKMKLEKKRIKPEVKSEDQ